MVAITVILAAVIGAFVLEIGDQQETAPNTSFDSEQAVKFYDSTYGANPGTNTKANLTSVDISHAGGTTLDISQILVNVNGNSSSWGMKNPNYETGGVSTDIVQFVPNILETFGSNDPVEFTSGETWNVYLNDNQALSRENLVAPGESTNPGSEYCVHYRFDPPDIGFMDDPSGNCKTNNVHAGAGDIDPLETGDDVTVVWEASSGGKTQTLFRYTVQ
jgi:hypothetical protein